MATEANIGILELFQLYRDMQQRLQEDTTTVKRDISSQNSAVFSRTRGATLDEFSMPPEKTVAGKRGNQSMVRSGSLTSLPVNICQLVLDVKACIFTVGEATELHFSLYSADRNEFVSESFFVSMTAAGMPEDINLLGHLKTVFKDITLAHFTSSLYLVCRIIRRGQLQLQEGGPKGKHAHDSFRRPFGCAVLNLTQAIATEQLVDGRELCPDNMEIFVAKEESQFASLHEFIIRNNVDRIDRFPRAKGIAVGVTRLDGEFAKLKKEKPELLKECVCDKTTITDIMDPGEVRNDLYITLQDAEFSMDRKTTAKNVEVEVKVLLDSGEHINCLHKGRSRPGHPAGSWLSTVYYHSNSPKYEETFRLEIPIDANRFERSHLLITLSHCSTKKGKVPFAFGFQKLTDDQGVAIRDTDHVVPTFKWIADIDKMRAEYLKDGGSLKLVPRKESITIRTKLCSTKKTQKEDLHALLNWRSLDENRLKQVLEKVTYLDDIEIVKFLREIFDVLFAILSSASHSSLHVTVYVAFVYILNVLVGKFAHFRVILESYFGEFFVASKVHTVLMNCLKYLLDVLEAPATQKTSDRDRRALSDSMKCLKWVFKCMIQSLILDTNNSPSSAELKATFKTGLLHLLDSIFGLMRKTSPQWIIGIQAFTLKSFAGVFEDLMKVVEMQELGEIAHGFIQCIPEYSSSQKNLNIEKLKLVRSFTASEMFERESSRTILMPTVVKQIKAQIHNSQDERILCLLILREALIAVQKTTDHAASAWGLSDILPDVCTTIVLSTQDKRILSTEGSQLPRVFIQEVEPLKDLAITSFLALISILDTSHWTRLLAEKFVTTESKRQFLFEVLRIGSLLVSEPIYPNVWVLMAMFEWEMCLKLVQWIGVIFTNTLSNSSSELSFSAAFDSELWNQYLMFCIELIQCPGLDLESFTAQKQAFVKSRYGRSQDTAEGKGDMRLEIMEELAQQWKSLKHLQTHFIDLLVIPLLELTRSKIPEVRALAEEMYYDLLQREFQETHCFTRVERQTISAVDTIVSSGRGSEQFLEMFTIRLDSKFRADPTITERGLEFLKEIKQLYDLLHALQKFPDSADYEDQRTTAALKLMAYVQRTGRNDMYIRYVHFLYRLHKKLGNDVEAGMACLQHANLLLWNTQQVLEAYRELPQEPAAARKERLYREAIERFGKGKCWEKAILLCELLRNRYETELYDYPRLSLMLREQASYFDSIISQERFFASHFRVAYYGKGFDAEYRDKEFVYRGCELENVMDFTARIRTQFPNAKMLKSTDVPDTDIRESDEQYISIATLTPSSELEMEGRSTEESLIIPAKIKKYKQFNDVKIFMYTRVKKSAVKSNNEFRDLWVTKHFLITSETFPTVRRRLEVVDRRELLLSPIENAVNNIADKTVELIAKSAQVREFKGETADTGPLSMTLNGVIDAAVNGGVEKYREAFLSDEYIRENPTHAPLSAKLRQVLKDQLKALEEGLTIHGLKCADAMRPLHEHLTNQLAKMKITLAPLVN
eukprot:GILJ01004791.1.p1 GENE.GILJ01004791.1~~GILJ01004791.1.p1  ORF type:complete len:1775 (+),score=309.30 GILJ01004791.1:791-5326(+)